MRGCFVSLDLLYREPQKKDKMGIITDRSYKSPLLPISKMQRERLKTKICTWLSLTANPILSGFLSQIESTFFECRSPETSTGHVINLKVWECFFLVDEMRISFARVRGAFIMDTST